MDSITTDKIWECIYQKFIPKLSENIGLKYFVKNRSKFEGWMQVELCETLSSLSNKITPEKTRNSPNDNSIPEKLRIDLVIDDYALELKTSNTSYEAEDVESKTRPITSNIDSIINDIKKLKRTTYTKKAIIFVVFPLPNNSELKWNNHIEKIENVLNRKLRCYKFKFGNKIDARIYLGEII